MALFNESLRLIQQFAGTLNCGTGSHLLLVTSLQQPNMVLGSA